MAVTYHVTSVAAVTTRKRSRRIGVEVPPLKVPVLFLTGYTGYNGYNLSNYSYVNNLPCSHCPVVLLPVKSGWL